VRAASRMEAALVSKVPEVREVVSRIGSPAVATDIMGYEQADVFVSLEPRHTWRPGLTRDGLIEELAAVLAKEDPGSEPSFTQPIQMRFNELLGGAVTDVAILVFGPDLDELDRIAAAVEGAIVPVSGVVDARVLSAPAVPLLEVHPRPLDAARLGLTVEEVLAHVRAVRAGLEAGVTYDGAVQVPIRILHGGATRPEALRDLPIPTPAGHVVPLSAVADVSFVHTPSVIGREDAQRRITIGFNVRGRELGEVVDDARARIEQGVPLPRGYRLELGGQYETFQEARARIRLLVPIVVALILGLLVWTFGRWRPAVLILGILPFACVGGVAALALRELPISISAGVGFIALSGIAVLNGVVLMSKVLRDIAGGVEPHEAMIVGARLRMRPVLMTALVAALGFIPMMLATGVGAEVQRPLATVVVGGLVSSTLLTLVILPAIYVWATKP
jgi:cobalt-zinc-cadmium resistance protein CzcA